MRASADETIQRRRLTRMKWTATGLLLLMAMVFILTHRFPDAGPWLGYLQAFSEAAMVGALADWFAVTALFKRPLGLPIPHTAIIPRRKDEIGDNLARFVEENFLVGDALRPRIAEIALSARMAEWLAAPGNAERVSGDAAAFSRWVLQALDDDELRAFVQRNLHVSLREARITPLVGRVLELLTRGDRYRDILAAGVRAARRALDENQHRIRERIESESPWWVPSFVDRELYQRIVGELETQLMRLDTQQGSAVRAHLDSAIADLVRRLEEDPETIAKGEAIKRELLDHPSVGHYLSRLWEDISDYLVGQSEDPDSSIRRGFERGLQRFARGVSEDPMVQRQIDDWLGDAMVHLVENYRGEISRVISDTVRTWDPEQTAERIELQVGRDLQFIRINGTLVGGLAGLAIHAVLQAVH